MVNESGSGFLYHLKNRPARWLRSILYKSPLGSLISTWRSDNYSSQEYWDDKLTGEFSSYLADTTSIAVRNQIVVTLLRQFAPNLESVLDLGCGNGSLNDLLDFNKPIRYTGVGISSVAIESATHRASNQDSRRTTAFIVSSISDFTPRDGEHYDAIIFSEVLSYLSIPDAVNQIGRLQHNLSPHGIFIVSMKDHPKSHAIMKKISSAITPITGILYQEITGAPRYRIVFNRERPAYLTHVFKVFSEGT
jgi:SAM-dependent methyltransferase